MAMSPTIVCNNILKRAFYENIDVSPMKLQKLLYFVACEYQKRTDEPLFLEPFEVWKYGPVLSSVYTEFSSYGKESISSYAKDARNIVYIINETTSPSLKESIDLIWRSFKDWGAIALSKLTHRDESAWSYAYDRYQKTIDPQKMKEDNTYTEFLSV